MRKLFLPVLVAFLFCAQLTAQTKQTVLTVGVPEKNGFSSERLQRIDKLFNNILTATG
jgi:hypothetical protein